ncbi:hypothetical protein [Sphingomonas sp. SORGH_AS_0879]|uniref:hypothetical protein n=1 Tax=Sphingomonas sp. SORGH_AS_0879 TaxID=3041790 RepID=UPI00278432D9|nr:hypothetical protein [Sphingomonas sp. SORGH_AS_0879]MDQ1229274.1 hypothetical protein [Sphingomonas sp. SORGH_AS_0879]
MAAAPKSSQAKATQPRPVDEAGRTLDRWGLPLSGPARLAALDGKPDPALAESADQPAAEPAAQGDAGSADANPDTAKG